MARNLTQKLLAAHVDGELPTPGEPIALAFDQSLTQDSAGTLVMLLLDAIGLDRVRTGLSAQYVDHNLVQQDYRNADDHLFLESACKRFGAWYSRPGNGVSHPLHMMRFGVPGKTLIGSDSHTPAAGSLGMYAVGAGGADVALAMSGEPVEMAMPEVWGVELTGELPDWVSAKDVILEMLRRHGVDGGLGRVIEVLPLTFRDETDHEALDTGDVLILEDLHRITGSDNSLTARRKSDDRTMELALELSARQRDLLRAGGLINWLRRRNGQKTAL